MLLKRIPLLCLRPVPLYPSAMDSSKRVIRLARPNATVSATAPNTQTAPQPDTSMDAVATTMPLNTSQQNSNQQSHRLNRTVSNKIMHQ